MTCVTSNKMEQMPALTINICYCIIHYFTINNFSDSQTHKLILFKNLV